MIRFNSIIIAPGIILTGLTFLSMLPAIALAQTSEADGKLLLKDFAPRTRLVVKETYVERAKFPVIDVHFHMAYDNNVHDVLNTMDSLNLQMVYHLGLRNNWGATLKKYADKWVRPFPGRFGVMANINHNTINDADFSKKAVAQLREDVQNGATALKIFKDLGLRWKNRDGTLIQPDDPRFDPVWEECGKLGIPVLIHINDVKAFFDPVDRFNERYMSLAIEGRSSWDGLVDVTHEQIQQWFENIIARHPNTNFIGAHIGMHYEHLHTAARWFDAYPNFYVDLGASYKHLGRQPYTGRKFCIRYQDRILFGNDIKRYPDSKVYRYFFRVMETDDEYFDHVEPGAHLPWKEYGLYLPDEVLEKIYYKNALRLFSILNRNE